LIPPFLFAALRLIGGAGLLLLILILMKREWIPEKGDWPALIIMGLLMSAGFFGLLSYGMQFVSTGETAVLIYCMPILVSFLAHFLLGEKLTFLKTIGLCSGVIGLLFVMDLYILSPENEKILFGQILIFLSAVCWSFANIYSKMKFASYDKTKMTAAWQMGIGSSILLFISLFSSRA
jgi:drug/metabolite transporter (DMT)-like permease